MSSVQAVIAALNQQNTPNAARQPVNRQSIKDRFGMTTSTNKDLKTHRSSHMENRSATTTTTSTTNTNRPSSSLVPLRHDSLLDSATRTKINIQQATRQQLVEKVEKMNAEINQLKQQLHGKAIDTPKLRACELPEMEMTTLPPACFIWFDVDDDGNTLSSPETDYDDIISDYNRYIFTQGQQQQHIHSLQSQLTACEIGTHWMINKYLGELELERLRARSLDTIVQSQEDLIDIMENKTIESTEQSHQKQQNFLLHSQLELQRMELDDKQEMMTLMADERDILVKKIKRLTQQLYQQQMSPSQQQQYAIEPTERRSKNHPRTISSSSTCSTSSYSTTISSTSMSCLDWANINNMQQLNHSTYLLSSFSKPPPIAAASANTANLYSPPQTPPPREKLPPLPASSSSSSVATTPNLSPRSTFVLATPSLSSSLATLESSTSLSLDCQRTLPHQNSMPDIRSHQDQHHQYHRRATHHYRRDSGDPTLCSPPGGLEKGTMRQKSFWKGWRQRLSS